MDMDITGRKLFVKALEEEGVDTIFGYPGGTVTDLFDELYKTDSINLVLPRHEQGLIHEAEGYAKSTGKVGVCLVTSGPGATNTLTGLADAHYDNVPLVCFDIIPSKKTYTADNYKQHNGYIYDGIIHIACK